MREVEIIVRGAPASGKTSALAMIVRKFREANFDVTYDQPPPSSRRAYNIAIEDIQERDLQPMKVHVREEVTDANSSPNGGQ